MVGSELQMARKPGRPRAIPAELVPVAMQLYQQGYGYRAISRILRNEHHINPHFSSVRMTLIRQGIVKVGGAAQ